MKVYENYGFYIFFVSPGYDMRIKDVYNEEDDFYIVSKKDFSNVYIATAYTYKYLNDLFKSGRLYFWASDMIIVKDFERETLYKTINSLIDSFDGDYSLLENMFTNIGSYLEVFETEEIRYDLL